MNHAHLRHNPRLAVQRAVYEVKDLPLCGEWAYRVACEKFGEELIASFPAYRHGPRKGQRKGYLCYLHASVGGWADNLPGGRGVLFPGTSDWKLAMATQYGDPKGHSVVARWHRDGTVEVCQTPEAAWKLFKVYGTEPRYG